MSTKDKQTLPDSFDLDDMGRRDMVLLEKALVGGWDINEAAFKAVPSVVLKMIADEHTPARTKLRAVAVLAALNKQNIDQRQHAIGEKLTIDANVRAEPLNMADLLSQDALLLHLQDESLEADKGAH